MRCDCVLWRKFIGQLKCYIGVNQSVVKQALYCRALHAVLCNISVSGGGYADLQRWWSIDTQYAFVFVLTALLAVFYSRGQCIVWLSGEVWASCASAFYDIFWLVFEKCRFLACSFFLSLGDAVWHLP